MDLLFIIHILIGLIMVFFLPGYVIIRLLYNKIIGIERWTIAIVSSICIAILIGLVLGTFGLFDLKNIIISYIALMFLIVVIGMIKKHKK